MIDHAAASSQRDSGTRRGAPPGGVFALFGRRVCPLMTLAAVFIAAGGAWTSSAAQSVNEGIRHFLAGRFEQAARSFAVADVADPDNPHITFDRGCVAAAQSDSEKAREYFQQASLGKSSRVSAASHYNLGCLAAGAAKAIFGDSPVDAQPEARREGLLLLTNSVQHFRDTLNVDEDHDDARHNLEVIRLWIKHMQARWEQRDREQQREELNLLEFLRKITRDQEHIRSETRALVDEPDSPRRRQAAAQAERRQRKLADEIRPLNEKIEAELAAPATAGTPTPPSDQDDNEKVITLLKRIAVEARDAMVTAADALSENAFAQVDKRQREVLDRLNEIDMAIAPYQDILGRSVALQQALSEQSSAGAEATTTPRSPHDEESALDPAKPAAGRQQQPAGNTAPPIDFEESAWREARVEQWSRMLALKAQAELPAVTGQLEAATAGPPDQGPNQGQPAQPSAEQLEALKQSMDKAVELAPQAAEHAQVATEKLADKDLDGAIPEQRRALELLREIADPLPDEQQQQRDNNDQQQGDSQNQDQQQQQSEHDQQASQQQPQHDLSREQAEAVLRRVRERERKYRDLEKQLKQSYGRRVRVDQDW